MENKNRLFDIMKKIDNSFKLKTINESTIINDNKFKFFEDKMDVIFLNHEFTSQEYDIDINNNNISVEWDVNFWINNNGIENIIININEISGTYDVLLIDKETGDTIKNINKNINEIEWKFNVDYDGLFKNKSLYINTLVFDFKEKTCTVNIN